MIFSIFHWHYLDCGHSRYTTPNKGLGTNTCYVFIFWNVESLLLSLQELRVVQQQLALATTGDGRAVSSPHGSVPIHAGHTGSNGAIPSSKQQPAICREVKTHCLCSRHWHKGKIVREKKKQDLQEIALLHPVLKALAAIWLFHPWPQAWN